MLSPATFIGIANAVGQLAPAAAAGRTPAHAPAPLGPQPGIQQARVLSTPPVAAPIAPPALLATPKSAAPALPATPPRNLPRGSLLDLSV